MALSSKQEDLKHVPWFSLTEWYEVYNQIYSNNYEEQEKGHKTLLVWKARSPKLPVGVDCTLSLIHVALRDREYTEKINKGELSSCYRNDLRMMYSLALMRFLNHICNIGHTKQTSLFQIAKQLNIPDWIVNIRHDAAHGHELPSLGTLRIAVNILLAWLHNEYWAVEIKNMIDHFNKKEEVVEVSESEEVQDVEDLIELWIATGLYIQANHSLISDLPDEHLRETLLDLRAFTLQESQKTSTSIVNEERESISENLRSTLEYKLETAHRIILSEISKCLSKSFVLRNSEAICSILCDNEVFIPSQDFLQIFAGEDQEMSGHIPLNFIRFWEGFIVLLQEKKLIEPLFLQLLQLVNNDKEKQEKRKIASQWLRAIADALNIHKISQKIRLIEDQISDSKNEKLSLKQISFKVRSKVESMFPDLKSPWLNCTIDIPFTRIDRHSVQQLCLQANEFTIEYMPPLLDLLIPKEYSDIQKHLISLLEIQSGNSTEKNLNLEDNTIYDLQNLTDFVKKQNEENKKSENELESSVNLSDETLRSSNWELVQDTENWSSCPFGLLPWQMNREAVKPLVIAPSKIYTEIETSKIVPGVIDRKYLKMRSEIDWNAVLKEKGVSKKSRKRPNVILIDRAIKVVKRQL